MTRAELVGSIVWKALRDERKPRDEGERPNGGRVLYMITGLGQEFLEGISKTFPEDPETKIRLEISPILLGEGAHGIDESHISSNPPVYWRNSQDGDIVLFAPSEEDLEAAGAGLNPVPRMDLEKIMSQTESWVNVAFGGTDPSEDDKAWMEALLKALAKSEICPNLEMFVDFAVALGGHLDLPLWERVSDSLWILQLPRNCLENLSGIRPVDSEFLSRLRRADRNVKCHVFLKDYNGEKLDIDGLREHLDDREGENSEALLPDPDLEKAIGHARALINDWKDIRSDAWTKSQEDFCRNVDWSRYGESLLKAKARPKSKSLGNLTLEFIDAEYSDEKDEALEEYLATLNTRTQAAEKDRWFFDLWQDRMRASRKLKLVELWRKYLFSDEVRGDDLLICLIEGVRSLLTMAVDSDEEEEAEGAGEDSDSREGQRRVIMVTAKNAEKESSWSNLDKRTYALFRLEARLLKDSLGPCFQFDFGKWLEDACVEGARSQRNREARQIELEMQIGWMDEGGDLDPEPGTKIRVFWMPSPARKQSIALAFPHDLELLSGSARDGRVRIGLEEFSIAPSEKKNGFASVSLQDAGTFRDVNEDENGSLVAKSPGDSQGAYEALCERLGSLRANNIIDDLTHDAVMESLDGFFDLYSRAILDLYEKPESFIDSGVVFEQASAFGDLCQTARENLTRSSQTRSLLHLVAEIGVTGTGHPHFMSIVAPWHPLRLAERAAKVKLARKFTESILSDWGPKSDKVEILFEKTLRMITRWYFPEIVSHKTRDSLIVSNFSGYGLGIKAEKASEDLQGLEATTDEAVRNFMFAADEYLQINPHQAANLSMAVYDSRSTELPEKLAAELIRKIETDPDLRCELSITHGDQSIREAIYLEQNVRFRRIMQSDTSHEFKSRLRVGVCGNRFEDGDPEVPRIDLAFMHDTINQQSVFRWESLGGSSDSLGDDFCLYEADKPKRSLDTGEGNLTEVGLSTKLAPKAVSQFVDLVYVTKEEEHPLDAGKRAYPVRRINYDSQAVRTAIDNAHKISDWVVSYDRISSRKLIQHSGIKIIRDKPIPGSDARVFMSSLDPGRTLGRHVKAELSGLSDQEIMRNSEAIKTWIVDEVVEVAGNKIMTAARSETAAKEIVGLAVAKAVISAALGSQKGKPIWLSLDDTKGWFQMKGQLADILAIVIEEGDDENFLVRMCVCEAKYVGELGNEDAQRTSMHQLKASVDRFRQLYIEKGTDRALEEAWGSRLLEILSSRQDYSRIFSTAERLESFRTQLSTGKVDYALCGESVVTLYDSNSNEWKISSDPADNVAVRQHVIGQRWLEIILKRAFSQEPLEMEGLQNLQWDCSSDGQVEATLDQAGGNTRGGNGGCDDPGNGANGNAGPDSGREPGDGESAEVDQEGQADESPEIAQEEQTSESTSAGEVLAVNPNPDDGGGREGDRIHPPDSEKRGGSFGENTRAELESIASLKAEIQNDGENEAWISGTSEMLQAALTGYGMRATFAEPPFVETPNGVFVCFKGHKTLTVSSINKKLSELKTTHALSVRNVLPKLGELQVFIDRPKRRPVDLATLWLGVKWPDSAPSENSSILIGQREDNGMPLFLNLGESFNGHERHGPHTLIAGETGSGKGVLVQNILLQLIAMNDPRNLQIHLIDPKFGVDFLWIEEAPHLNGGIVTEQDDARMKLAGLVEEMERRYSMMKQHRVPNYTEYNKLAGKPEHFPLIILIHDEMGDWMADSEDYRNAIQTNAARLGMKARAAGIHLFMITQRASKDAIPVNLRDNLNNRLCLKVASEAGSNLVLGEAGGEDLLGRGHMLASLLGSSPDAGEFFNLQVPYASTEELQGLASAAIMDWAGKA